MIVLFLLSFSFVTHAIELAGTYRIEEDSCEFQDQLNFPVGWNNFLQLKIGGLLILEKKFVGVKVENFIERKDLEYTHQTKFPISMIDLSNESRTFQRCDEIDYWGGVNCNSYRYAVNRWSFTKSIKGSLMMYHQSVLEKEGMLGWEKVHSESYLCVFKKQGK